VQFENCAFRVGHRKRDHLEGLITDMLPMRKRFEGKRLVCWSNDGINGRYAQRCALCTQRWTCAERVRLMLLLDGLEQQALPAILEIGYASFDALEQFVGQATDLTAHRPVRIGIEREQGHLRFTFQQPD